MTLQDLLDILACPACKGGLTPLEDQSSLHCPACGLKYPIREGIPVMLLDEAERVADRTTANGGS